MKLQEQEKIKNNERNKNEDYVYTREQTRKQNMTKNTTHNLREAKRIKDAANKTRNKSWRDQA